MVLGPASLSLGGDECRPWQHTPTGVETYNMVSGMCVLYIRAWPRVQAARPLLSLLIGTRQNISMRVGLFMGWIVLWRWN